MTNEEKKQELIALIENVDIEALHKLDPDWSFSNNINKFHNISKALLRCQKQPIIEQQLEAMGFKNTRDKEGLYFYRAWELVDIIKNTIMIGFKMMENIHYQAILAEDDHIKILSFAKYLVELKKANENV